MAGGYHEDRYVQGCTVPVCQDDPQLPAAYTFRHWSSVDVFVYFSHSFVTIPPDGWVHAGHRNGVPVLGTIIAEGLGGAVTCAAMLASDHIMAAAAQKLAAVTRHHGFDGWLINIECPLLPPHVVRLKRFLGLLRNSIAYVGGTVIWYDAVTCEGCLAWQNSLSDLNYEFFACTDGIFTNYAWTLDLLAGSASAALDRRADVYMGVDVFGRGTFGGGGSTTDDAVAPAAACGLSSAVFAPGWAYETCEPTAEWGARDARLWRSIASARHPHVAAVLRGSSGGPQPGLEACLVLRPTVLRLPWSTDFDVGTGCSMWQRPGCVVSAQPWFNLSCQGSSPLRLGPREDSDAADFLAASVDHSIAFSGGASLRLTGALEAGVCYTRPLFACDVAVSSQPLHLQWAATIGEGLDLLLLLTRGAEVGEETRLVLLEASEVDRIPPQQTRLDAHWFMHHAILGGDLSGWRVRLLCAHISGEESGRLTDFHLGFLALYEDGQDLPLAADAVDVCCVEWAENREWLLNCRLTWTGGDESAVRWHLWAVPEGEEPRWIGVSIAKRYEVVGLALNRRSCGFSAQPESGAGVLTPLHECPTTAVP